MASDPPSPFQLAVPRLARPPSCAMDRSRSSSPALRNSGPPSPTTRPSPRSALDEQPALLTAPALASRYLANELHYHNAEPDTQTVVILHNDCFGHRFSRPGTKKTALGDIVERPERLHAGILGISSAYVRLAGRHTGGLRAPHPERDPQPSEIPFTIRRTSRTLDIASCIVTNVHGSLWMKELQGMCHSAAEKLASTGKELARAQEPGQSEKEQLHEGDLYLCSQSLSAFEGALGGVCDGIDAVFSAAAHRPRNAFVCVRPPGHHCSADFPSGFCWLNNVHVGIEYAVQHHGLTHAAIIDFDLHHGDGSQALAWERNAAAAEAAAAAKKSAKQRMNTQIGYFSIHDVNSYPCEYGDPAKVQAASLCIENAHSQTIWNVHLQPWKTQAEFWALYESRYLTLVDKARAFLRSHSERLRASPNQPQPRAAIFISAGFDASEWESQGMQRHEVNVPTDFYARFTSAIVRMSQEEHLGVDGRVVSVLEGGYSDRALTSGVLSHLSGLCDGQKAPAAVQEPMTPDDRIAQAKLTESGERTLRYNAEWWSEANLAALETLVNPRPPPPASKKQQQRGLPHGNFAAPTHASFARHTASGHLLPIREPPKLSNPPPVHVDWSVAAHELCKLLVPTDRQTKSCQPDELSWPRFKKEQPPPPVMSVNPNGGRCLRQRRSKVPEYQDPLPAPRQITTSDRSNVKREIPPVPVLQQRRSDRSPIEICQQAPTDNRPLTVASAQAASGVQPKKTRGSRAIRMPHRPAPYRAVSCPQTDKTELPSHGVDQVTSSIGKITLISNTGDNTRKPAAIAGVKAAAPRKAAEMEDMKPATDKTEHEINAADTLDGTSATNQPALVGAACEASAGAVPPAHRQPHGVDLSQKSKEALAERIEKSFLPSLQFPSELPGAPSPHVILEAAGPVHVPEVTPRPDSPPPPPPVTLPHFVQYHAPADAHFATAAVDSSAESSLQQTGLQWALPSSGAAAPAAPAAPAHARALPVFSPQGLIPFAMHPNGNSEARIKQEKRVGSATTLDYSSASN